MLFLRAGARAGRALPLAALLVVLVVAPIVALVGAPLRASAEAGLKVVVTSKPIHALVAGVMQGIGAPKLLVSGAQSPHTYALKPSDAAAAAQADVVFRLSADVEPFSARLFSSLPEAVVRVSLAEARGVVRLPARSGGTFEPHEHGGKHAAHEENHGKGGHGTGGHGKGGHGEPYDGHVWLDPANARAMVGEVARVLSALRPSDGVRINGNADRVVRELTDLDKALAARLAPARGRAFIVFHDAIQYLEHRYGLEAAGAIVAHPDAAPSARRLSAVRAQIRTAGVRCVFAEPQISARLVTAVREGTAARTGILDPEGTQLAPGPDLYVALMRKLADALVGCLADG